MIISTGEFMKKLLFVFNPNSGKAQLKNKLMQIVQIFIAFLHIIVQVLQQPEECA